jgi:N-acetylated-alpha-linked acidic dipeptidase
VSGHIVMRTADAQVLPMRFDDFSSSVDRYVAQLHEEVAAERQAAQQQEKLFSSNAYRLAADPTRPLAPPERSFERP